MEQKTRYHAEIHLTLEGHEVRINVFADTLAEIQRDLGTIAAQYPPDWQHPAKREIANAQLKAQQIEAQRTATTDKPKAYEPPIIPLCRDCGSVEYMELISFIDKKTGNARQAWKCQKCGKWHFDKNGKGH